jgi:hypothetical protein
MTEARRLGRFGIWRSASLVTPELAEGIERLGFGALWLGSSPAGDLALAADPVRPQTPAGPVHPSGLICPVTRTAKTRFPHRGTLTGKIRPVRRFRYPPGARILRIGPILRDICNRREPGERRDRRSHARATTQSHDLRDKPG